MRHYKKLEEYGIIGNLKTIALISNDGPIDWFCMPYIESESVFAGILDIEKGGHFSIQPVQPFESMQKYIQKTNILQTMFSNPAGFVTVTDFMPVQLKDSEETVIYRKITCTEGHVDLRLIFKPRFDYARVETFVNAESQSNSGIAAKKEKIIQPSISCENPYTEAIAYKTLQNWIQETRL
ncbi:MAG: Glycoside hydrolase 15-related protein [uncultured bacterium]|nr:MAG: Glycoside hydrolase 15-related protein [uncultured bacterium]